MMKSKENKHSKKGNSEIRISQQLKEVVTEEKTSYGYGEIWDQKEDIKKI